VLRIGLDVGHSSVKAVYSWQNRDAGQIIFPTLVIPGFRLMDERAAAAGKLDTVVFEGEWFVGDTAARQGKLASYSGQDREWVFSKTHDILVLSALDRIKRESGYGIHGSVLTVGLPAAFYASQRANLRSRLIGILSSYYGEELAASVSVRIQPQPYGPIYLIALQPDGTKSERNLQKESWGVVEIGHFTTDYILIDQEQIIEHASGSAEGFRGVYERLTPEFADLGFSAGPSDLTHAITSGWVMHYGQKVDVKNIVAKAVNATCEGILSDVQRLFGPYLPKLNGLIVAGGAAPLIAPALFATYPHTRLLENPRFAVAEGFRRHSCAVAPISNGGRGRV
jgi:plasmid segregation protein ParM